MLFDKRPHDKIKGTVATEITSSKEKILEVWSSIPENRSVFVVCFPSRSLCISGKATACH